jgi:hypothetical protein
MAPNPVTANLREKKKEENLGTDRHRGKKAIEIFLFCFLGFLVLFWFWWNWGLNSRLCSCKSGTLPHEPHLQSGQGHVKMEAETGVVNLLTP